MRQRIVVFIMFLFWVCLNSLSASAGLLESCSDMIVTNTTLTNADTEYSITILAQARSISLKARTSNSWKYSWTSGESGSVYTTVPAGAIYYEENILFPQAKIIYVQSPTAGIIIELTYCR